MRLRGPALGLSALASMLLLPSEAGAGTTAPLSSIAALPAPIALKVPEAPATIPGLTMKSKDNGATRWHDLLSSTGRGYCIVEKDTGYRWTSSHGSSSQSTGEELDLDRLIEKDGKATLERTRLHFAPMDGTIAATGRSQVELKEIARTDAGVVVWAFREDRTIVVLTKRVERGVESRQLGSEENGVPFVSSDGCPFAGARLDARKPEAGTFVQLTGTLPPRGTGKDKVTPTFIVDVSLSRVTRDPEPLLAVRVRVRD